MLLQVESDTEWEEADTECGDVSEVVMMMMSLMILVMIVMMMIADWQRASAGGVEDGQHD